MYLSWRFFFQKSIFPVFNLASGAVRTTPSLCRHIFMRSLIWRWWAFAKKRQIKNHAKLTSYTVCSVRCRPFLCNWETPWHYAWRVWNCPPVLAFPSRRDIAEAFESDQKNLPSFVLYLELIRSDQDTNVVFLWDLHILREKCILQ